MAAVSHPNIAQIFGFETWRNTPILIVEYFQGGTLFDRLRHGQLPESEVVAMGLALADGLDRLHASGLLHRDVKPSNVGFTWDRVPKLLDFGLTKLIETPESWTNPAAENLVRATDAPTKNNLITLTGTMHAPGTPAYMSPEAIRGAPPQPSFDLWALALLLYEAITGRNPVRSENLFEMLDRIERASIPDVRTFVAGCGVSLAGFLADALHNDERRRPSSAQEFRARLSAQR
jgi:serine/threonine protein kinase